MLHHAFSEKFDINYIKASEPFALEELLALIAASDDKDVAENHGHATVLDLRQVHLAGLETPKIRRHIMKKSALTNTGTTAPCAYLVNGVAAFSMVRMALVYSELAGTTPEDMTFITEDLSEVGQCLAEILMVDPVGISVELENIAQPPNASVTRI